VVAAAELAGIGAAITSRSAPELKALAQAARYTGRTALALRAWHAIRQRFPGHPAAQQAAFFLGRIHDQQGQAGEARRWLGVYLTEAPSGVYASEALGRQMMLQQKGPADVAQRSARQYLDRFPNGAYAKAARSILAAAPRGDAQRGTIADR
jgi:TolA-binding protein